MKKKVDLSKVALIIYSIFITIVFIGGCWVAGRLYNSTTDYRYVKGTVVTDTYGWITVVDDSGDRWEFDNDELHCGDRVQLKMDCNDTARIYDDKYVSYKLLEESEE